MLLTGSSTLLLTSSTTLGWKGEDMLEECKLFLQGVVYYCEEETADNGMEEDEIDDNEMKKGRLRRMIEKMGKQSNRHAVMKCAEDVAA